MKLTLQTPTKLYIDDLDEIRLSEIRASLTYKDQKVVYELRKLKRNYWLAQKIGQEAFDARVNDLKERATVCLLNQDPDGRYWCLSGMKGYLETKYGIKADVKFKYPEPRLIPWEHVPTRTPYPYQETAKERLLEAFHARVEMGTGLGKSFIILNLAKSLGLKTVVMAPSQNIAEQLYREFLHHFGKKHVGAFFDGKKDYKKLFIIGTGQSLTRVDPASEIGKVMSEVQVFIADESHQCPAATLAKVCTGVLQNAPYRYFFSATQIRNDGLDLLLDAISGQTVFEMTVREGVDQGYLAKPVFKMIETRSDRHYDSDDANEMTREHLYYNPRVLAQAGEIANLSVSQLGHQVLILIDEVEQFTRLLPFLKHKAQFAHGPLAACKCGKPGWTADKGHDGNVCKVPAEYREVDNGDLVDRFNRNEFPILIGTSCISTGTDIRSVKTMIYLKGGKSEIEVRQGVGRCTRKVDGKTACTVIDFDVTNIPVLTKHAAERRSIFDDTYGPTETVEWG